MREVRIAIHISAPANSSVHLPDNIKRANGTGVAWGRGIALTDALADALEAAERLGLVVPAYSEEGKTPADVVGELAIKLLERELEGLRAFRRGVHEALNEGDGSYRP